MARGDHADAAGQIDERIAVDVVDERTFCAIDHDIGRAPEPAHDGVRAAVEQGATLRAGDLGDAANRCHGGNLTSWSAGNTSTMP